MKCWKELFYENLLKVIVCTGFVFISHVLTDITFNEKLQSCDFYPDPAFLFHWRLVWCECTDLFISILHLATVYHTLSNIQMFVYIRSVVCTVANSNYRVTVDSWYVDSTQAMFVCCVLQVCLFNFDQFLNSYDVMSHRQ